MLWISQRSKIYPHPHPFPVKQGCFICLTIINTIATWWLFEPVELTNQSRLTPLGSMDVWISPNQTDL